MQSDSIIDNIRNIVYEILMSVFTPCVIALTFFNITGKVLYTPGIDKFQTVLLTSLLAFVFPMIR